MSNKVISILIPIYNERKNIPVVYKEVVKAIKNLKYKYEIIFIDDGSNDGSIVELKKLTKVDKNVVVIELSRNFSKEIAISSGLAEASGDAVIMIDADLQHPPELIPDFISNWTNGADVVVGVRKSNEGQSIIAKSRSWLFYKTIEKVSNTKITPHATDYRLIDRRVVDEFNRFTEHKRITRGLIDWLGFDRVYIYFDAPKRLHGEAKYGLSQLINLAANSFVSLSFFPLKLVGYLGAVITIVSALLGIAMFIEIYPMHDALNINISGTAVLAVVNIFLAGMMLSSLGLLAMYIAHIHSEVVNRPLYVVRDIHKTKSPKNK